MPANATVHPTREAWLRAAAADLNVILERHVPDFPLALSALAVSVGFPRGGRKRIGECWSREVAADQQTHSVFVSPVLEEPIDVLAVLLHEMVHAAVGTDAKHAGPFRKAAAAVGLEKPWTATVAGPELFAALQALSGKLGAYPHVRLTPKQKPASERANGVVKLYSASVDDYVVRMKRSAFEESGAPLDPNGEEMLEDQS